MNIVHFEEVQIINTVVTSKEAILTVCRELAVSGGLQSLNIRTVADKCNVSVGSIYNYFPSKSALVTAVIQDIWQRIFHLNKAFASSDSFTDYVLWIFETIQTGSMEYPNFFMAHSMSFATTDKGKGKQMMEEYFKHIKLGMLEALQKDKQVKPSVFTEDFTPNNFIDFIFSNIITSLMKQENSCTILIEVIKRILY